MAVPVADRSSNKPETIEHAVQVLGRSTHRRKVFQAIYSGKARVKTVPHLMTATELGRTRVLDAGKALADNDLVERVASGYAKIDFIQRYRDKILAGVGNPTKLATVPTKRNPRGGSGHPLKISIRIPKRGHRATLVTVDDIDNFANVRRVPHGLDYVRISETAFKNGVAALLGERASFKDWGGELRDLSSTHLRLKGKRRAVAVAFKGPGKTGRLTPGKMGKNGDQLQRLSKCPAEVFLVQYWQDVDDSVLEQLENLVRLKSFLDDRPLWYGIVDGDDSARLIRAYPKHFQFAATPRPTKRRPTSGSKKPK